MADLGVGIADGYQFRVIVEFALGIRTQLLPSR